MTREKLYVPQVTANRRDFSRPIDDSFPTTTMAESAAKAKCEVTASAVLYCEGLGYRHALCFDHIVAAVTRCSQCARLTPDARPSDIHGRSLISLLLRFPPKKLNALAQDFYAATV